MVEACALHHADDGFDRMVICVAESDPANPAHMTTANVEVLREAWRAALRRAGESGNATAALAKVRGDDSAKLYQQICAELRLHQ